MKSIEPNYQFFVTAMRNQTPERMPIYDHGIDLPFVEKATGLSLTPLEAGTAAERRQCMRAYLNFCRERGYDAPPYERGIPASMPGSGALRCHAPGCIHSWEDLERYPWDKIPDLFFSQQGMYFELLAEEMPEGMKAVGGPGYGVFEAVQDLIGYQDLCFLRADDPELYEELFARVGQLYRTIWKRFLKDYADAYCVCRFGDDLGFQTSTLLPHDDIRRLILPVYRDIVEMVHQTGRPFLLHSCGNLFPIMEDILATGIDGKHSNEDAIAPFSRWVELYGDRICNLGGIDMNILCTQTPEYIERVTIQTIEENVGHGGFALGSGNSVPDYVPVEGYMAMNRAANRWRLNQYGS